jgi:hypothetical protein
MRIPTLRLETGRYPESDPERGGSDAVLAGNAVGPSGFALPSPSGHW